MTDGRLDGRTCGRMEDTGRKAKTAGKTGRGGKTSQDGTGRDKSGREGRNGVRKHERCPREVS